MIKLRAHIDNRFVLFISQVQEAEGCEYWFYLNIPYFSPKKYVDFDNQPRKILI